MKSRRLRSLLSFGVAVALTAQMVTIAPAYAVTRPRAELASKRTRFSRTFDNGDGTFDYEGYTTPINYVDAVSGAFEPIDESLVDSSTGSSTSVWRNAANQFHFSLPKKLAGGWISFETTAATLSYRPASRASARNGHANESTGEALPMDGKRVGYGRAFDDASLEYQSMADGLKESIVLPDYVGSSTFSFDLMSQGATPTINAQGGIDFYSSDSTSPVISIAAPYMVDSASGPGGDGAMSAAVHYELYPQSLGWRLDVVADPSWLADSARVYPVRIDPTTYADWPDAPDNSGDTYVSDANPNTNYLNHYDNGFGIYNFSAGYDGSQNCRAYVNPDLYDFITNAKTFGWDVVNAYLGVTSYYQETNYGSGPYSIYLDRIDSSWNPSTLTWNNQPTLTGLGKSSSVYAGQMAKWYIQDQLNDCITNGRAYAGFALVPPTFGDRLSWSKFYSYLNAMPTGPFAYVRYTTHPSVKLTGPTPDTTPGNGVRVSWDYSDNGTPGGKPLHDVHVVVKQGSTGGPTVVDQTTQVSASATSLVLSPPSGGWADGQYWVQMQASGIAEDGSISWSPWTALQPFDYKKLSEAPVGRIEPYRAQDSVGGGASVDLSSGRLLISRSDFSGPGLGGALGIGATYDSSATVDTGFGKGWSLGVPQLALADQRAPNPSFETVGSGNEPSGWTVSNTTRIFLATTPTHGGGRALKFSVPGPSYQNYYVSTAPDGAHGISVYPGQRLYASVWVDTFGLTADTSQAEYGAIMKMHLCDSTGAELSTVKSENFKQSYSNGWTKLSVQTNVPAGVYRATLNLECRNAYGTILYDDVYFGDSTLALTGSDGAARSFKQTGSGTYQRDPLLGKLAVKRTNVALSSTVTNSQGSSGLGDSVNGVINNCPALGNYDTVSWKADGTAYLEYALKKPTVLSEADLYLWDGAETTSRTYTYAIRAHPADAPDANSGWVTVTPDPSTNATSVVSRSWNQHFFSPIKADRVRVIALGNTANSGFHVCQLELPVTSLADDPIGFDANGRVTGVADLSGNVTTYRYDSSGRLNQVSDRPGRTLAVNRDANGQVSMLDWTGIGSNADTSTETGIVSYDYSSGLAVRRKNADGTYAQVVTYGYDGNNRIQSVTDADGAHSTIGYDPGGTVHSVTRSGGGTSTPDLVTTYTYGANSVTITSSGGADSVTREIDYDPACGYGPTKTIADPNGSLKLATTVTRDEYGHVTKVTDPAGKSDTYVSDPHGNVLTTLIKGSIASTATYTNDHVATTVDPKGNSSSYQYDDAWRLLSTTVPMTDDGTGTVVAAQVYDSWGNRTLDDVGGSTGYDLLTNGTFERDPSLAGDGWDQYAASPTDAAAWLATGSLPNPDHTYLGAHVMEVGQAASATKTGAYWKDSNDMAVTPGKTYVVSGWTAGQGQIRIIQLDSAGNGVSPFNVPVSTAGGLSGKLRRVSGYYVVPSNVVKVHLQLFVQDGTLYADNVTFQQANAAGADNFLDNESFEWLRSPGGLPLSWTARSTGTATQESTTAAFVSGGHSVAVTCSQKNDSSGDGYFISDYIPVNPGEQYSASVFAKLASITSTASGGVVPKVWFYRDTGGTPSSTAPQSITSTLTGTADWRRYIAPVSVPSDTNYVRVDLHTWSCSGTVYFDQACLEPAVSVGSHTFDSQTHTFDVSDTDLAGHQSQTTYDSRGRATSVSHADATGAGSTTDAQMSYDALDRLTTVSIAPTSTLGVTAAYGYSAAGRLTTITAPAGDGQTHQTVMAYNAAGQPTTAQDPLGYLTQTEYDGLGRTKTTYHAHLASEAPVADSTSSYDAASRITSVTAFDMSGGSATTNFTYDADSRITHIGLSGAVSASADTTYDAVGRMATTYVQGPAGSSSFAFAYDASSLLTGMSWNGLGTSATVANVYAKTGQLNSTTNLGHTWNFSWHSDGALGGWFADKFASRYVDYDSAHRQANVRLGVSVQSSDTLTPIADLELSYDGRNRLGSVVSKSTTGGADATDAYAYDPVGRLSTWTYSSEATPVDTAAYAYDAAGNVTSATLDATATGFTYDAANRLVGSTSAGASTAFTNDGDGHRTAAVSANATTTYAWDAQGHLASVVSSLTTATYVYGVSGMREAKTVVAQGMTTTTTAIWNAGQMIAERDSDGTTYKYAYGPAGAPLSLTVIKDGVSTSYAYMVDAQGTVIGLTDPSGTRVAMYRYDPWGRVLEASGGNLAQRQPLRYHGYYYDAESGFYYMPNRYYDPMTYRFLSADPAPAKPGDPASLNAFSYCENDPVNNSDPSGADMGSGGTRHGAYTPGQTFWVNGVEYMVDKDGNLIVLWEPDYDSPGENVAQGYQNEQAGGEDLNNDPDYNRSGEAGQRAREAKVAARRLAKAKAAVASQNDAYQRAVAAAIARAKALMGSRLSMKRSRPDRFLDPWLNGASWCTGAVVVASGVATAGSLAADAVTLGSTSEITLGAADVFVMANGYDKAVGLSKLSYTGAKWVGGAATMGDVMDATAGFIVPASGFLFKGE